MWEEMVKAAWEGLGTGTVLGLKEVIEEFYKFCKKHGGDQRLSDMLDEMLRNPDPTKRFRKTSTMAGAIHDTSEGYTNTVALLTSMMRSTKKDDIRRGTRHNIRPGGTDSWTNDNYWEKKEGKWKLRDEVTSGGK